MNVIMQGVMLLIIGMGVLFAAMGLLILAMVLLERIFRTRQPVPDEGEPKETSVVSTLGRDTEDEEIVAAIAVALAHLRSLEISQSGLGTALEAGRSSWWTTGQMRQRPVNTLRTRQGRR